jgi:hypothetical protein
MPQGKREFGSTVKAIEIREWCLFLLVCTNGHLLADFQELRRFGS